MFNWFKKKNKKDRPDGQKETSGTKSKLTKEDIHTMPEKFYVAPKRGISKKLKWGLIVGAGVVILAGGTIFFSIDWSSRLQQPDSESPSDQVARQKETETQSDSKEDQEASPQAEEDEPGVSQEDQQSEEEIQQPEQEDSSQKEEDDEYAATEELTEEVKEDQGVEEISNSTDSDGDGLTDIEEALYNTKKDKPDTDADGYLDGHEVQAGFDPALADKRLVESETVKKHSSLTYKYSILYPAVWGIKALDNTGAQVVFQPSDSKEFIEVIVMENNDSLVNWYQENVSLKNERPVIENLNGWQSVRTEDRLTVYLSKRQLPMIYIINYNTANLAEINFRTTFNMMVNSFTLLEDE